MQITQRNESTAESTITQAAKDFGLAAGVCTWRSAQHRSAGANRESPAEDDWRLKAGKLDEVTPKEEHVNESMIRCMPGKYRFAARPSINRKEKKKKSCRRARRGSALRIGPRHRGRPAAPRSITTEPGPAAIRLRPKPSLCLAAKSLFRAGRARHAANRRAWPWRGERPLPSQPAGARPRQTFQEPRPSPLVGVRTKSYIHKCSR